MYNHSLYTGISPDGLKSTILNPLYKKETKLLLQIKGLLHYYLFISKVFQKAIYGSRHLHTNNILVTEQHGFRKGISTENPAFRLTDSVLKSVNQKMMHIGGILCNLEKAFNF